MNDTERKKPSPVRRLISIVCIAVLLFGGAYLVDIAWQGQQVRASNERYSDSYHRAMANYESAFPSALADDVSGGVEDDVDWETLSLFDMPIIVDTPIEERVLQPVFEELYQENNDLVGWITCGGNVDYPIVYRDNSFYLDHDFDEKSSNAGAIFLDERNNPDMSDGAMLIYGHNMRVGTMFGDLDMYRKESYVRENPIVTIHNAYEEEPRQYVLFSLFDASMNPDDSSYIRITRFNFETDEEKAEYIESLEKKSLFKLGLETNPEDQLICLVTCSYSHDNGRFLLFARQLHEDETVESVMETLNPQQG